MIQYAFVQSNKGQNKPRREEERFISYIAKLFLHQNQASYYSKFKTHPLRCEVYETISDSISQFEE